MAHDFINKKLIFPRMKFSDRTAALSFLANQLTDNDYVKASFKPALLKREKSFPTGLPTGKVKVAIPHADWQNVNYSGIAVATLTKPVRFNNMADPESELEASIIFTLAINEPHGQVKLLKELMKIVQDQSHLEKLLSYENNDDLFIDLKNTFSALNI